MKTIPTIKDFNFNNKRALVRVDFNVPFNDSLEVTDSTRIKAAIPTIKYIIENGGSVVLMSHLGRPKNGVEDKFSLKHILSTLETELSQSVQFIDDCVGDDVLFKSKSLNSGEVLLLENLRFYKEETAGDETFAKQLSLNGDVYVNDAFGTAHRAHASTAVIAEFMKEKCFGFLMANEISSVEKVLNASEQPFTAIIGGAKVSSKITIIEKLLPKIDNLIIGGGMAYTFAKAQGGNVGSSLVEDDFLSVARDVISKAKQLNVNVIIPNDSLIADKFSNDANVKVSSTNQIPDGWMGLDIGDKAIQENNNILLNSKTILWNGPMGVFEMDSFAKGTEKITESVVKSTINGAYSLVGGGDSVAAVNKFNAKDKVSYVSTGGGALLEYMEGIELPGIKAVLN